jgi:hypothetical protein
MTGHWGWRRVRDFIGAETFDQYRRVCVERDAYDKSVSDWLYHRDVLSTTTLGLAEYIQQRRPSDWTRYAEGDQPVATVLRFENLAAEFGDWCAATGLPPVGIGAYQLKRNACRGVARDYHDAASCAAIADVFARELEYYGYRL